MPGHLTDRLAEQRRIARENGEAIIEDPAVVLRAITHQWPSFTLADVAQFLRSRTDESQFDAAYLAVTKSDDLVPLPPDAGGRERFTSRDMVEAARSLRQRVLSMAGRRGHGVAGAPVPPPSSLPPTSNPPQVDDEQRRLFDYLTSEGDAKAIAVIVAEARDALLTAVRRAWEANGLRVTGAVLSRGRRREFTKNGHRLADIGKSRAGMAAGT